MLNFFHPSSVNDCSPQSSEKLQNINNNNNFCYYFYYYWRRHRWEENIRMKLKKIGINTGNWVNSAQDRDYLRALVIAALNLRFP